MSLLLHLVLAAATWRIPLAPSVDPAMADELAREVELFLLPDEDAATESEMPKAFTSVPDRQARRT